MWMVGKLMIKTDKKLYNTTEKLKIMDFILPELNFDVLVEAIKNLSDKTFKVWIFFNLIQQDVILNKKSIMEYFDLTPDEYDVVLKELIEKGYYQEEG
jgi:hypothetical protein